MKVGSILRGMLEARQRARLFGKLAPMVPPVRMMFDGPPGLETFKENGDEFFNIYKDIGGLRTNERMLDVGFGIGRKTIPLTQYFDDRASYEGLDIVKEGVDWCSRRITSLYPNFQFQLIDVHNNFYNPDGIYKASEYRFPFRDESFDFVMLGSVFTHMLPDGVHNYLSEISRVLAPEGRCMITCFLLNQETLDEPLHFRFGDGVYRTVDQTVPELTVAYEEGWIRELHEELGLTIQRIDYGSWCGRRKYLSYQDLVFAVKH